MIVRNWLKDCYITSDGREFKDLLDALIYELGYENKKDKLELNAPNFFCLYDESYLGEILAFYFDDVIISIYHYPDTKIVRVDNELNQTQEEFLEKVRELGIQKRILDKLGGE